jgi:prolyl oligopeptidase
MNLARLSFGVILAIALAGVAIAQTADLTPDSPDPYLWLTDIHGAKPLAWAKEQNEKTFSVLQSDPQYKQDHDAILTVLNANDRIAMGELDHGDVYNFWQDAGHVRGIWRKTSAADYRNADPKWDVLLDVDKLDADEHTDWVWQGARCAPGMKRCLVRLSPGGGDASVVREYDPKAKAFLKDGFSLAVAKSNAEYVDADTILFSTDFGPGSMTVSSYPRIVKLWHRGQPIGAAKTIFEGQTTDISSSGQVFRGPYGTIPLIVHGLTFFTAEYFTVKPDGSTVKLPLPLGADLKGVTAGNLIFTLRDAWTPPGAAPIPQGSLVAFPVQRFVKTNKPSYNVLFTPDARATIDDVSPGRDAVYASIFENVTGSIHEFRPGKSGAWSDTTLDLPKGGSTHIVSADDWTPLAQFTFESFLQPVTLYTYDGKGAPVAIKSEPSRFDASGLVTDQFWATSADGTKIPYFLPSSPNRGPWRARARSGRTARRSRFVDHQRRAERDAVAQKRARDHAFFLREAEDRPRPLSTDRSSLSSSCRPRSRCADQAHALRLAHQRMLAELGEPREKRGATSRTWPTMSRS